MCVVFVCVAFYIVTSTIRGLLCCSNNVRITGSGSSYNNVWGPTTTDDHFIFIEPYSLGCRRVTGSIERFMLAHRVPKWNPKNRAYQKTSVPRLWIFLIFCFSWPNTAASSFMSYWFGWWRVRFGAVTHVMLTVRIWTLNTKFLSYFGYR